MTRISFYSILAIIILISSCTSAPKGKKIQANPEQDLKTRLGTSEEYIIDTDNSLIDWEGSKATGKHSGTLKGIMGAINIDSEGVLFLGKFAINMNTINVTDLADPKQKADLERHLMSADFFDIAKFPQTTFQTTDVSPIADGGRNTHQISGNLNMHGVNKNISFPAMIRVTNNSLILKSGRITIDRTQWDIKYKSGVIGTIKDKLIHDELGLQLSIVASKRPK